MPGGPSIGELMTRLGPSRPDPSRKGEPLRVLAMAMALVVAAIAGAALGFVLDFFAPDDAAQTGREV